MGTAFRCCRQDGFSGRVNRSGAVEEGALAGFAAGRFGIGDEFAFGEWGGLPLALALEPFDLFKEFGDLLLLSLDQLDQFGETQRCQIDHRTFSTNSVLSASPFVRRVRPGR